jgi:hypothetical protein
MVYQKKKKKERERERSNSNHYQAERPMIAGQWVCRACPGQRIAHDLSRGPFLFSLVVAVLRSRDRVLAFFFSFFLFSSIILAIFCIRPLHSLGLCRVSCRFVAVLLGHVARLLLEVKFFRPHCILFV